MQALFLTSRHRPPPLLILRIPLSPLLLSRSLSLFQMSSSSSLVLPTLFQTRFSSNAAADSIKILNPSSRFPISRHGFRTSIRKNLQKYRVFMSVSVGSTTAAAAVEDSLFADYKPTSAFLFPGQVMG